MIISATRRTDIPSFYGDWFMNRLTEGYVLIQNPYNENRYSRATLTKDAIDIIIFWTKNPIPFLKHLDTLDTMSLPYYFEFTLTPYGKETEKNLPEKEELIQIFIDLAKRIGKHRMVWRYDPIIIDERYNTAYHKEQFSYMVERLSDSATRCVISFVDNYKNVKTRMGKDPSLPMTNEIIFELSQVLSVIAKKHNLPLFTCAEKIDLSSFGIEHGACIDKNLIKSILQKEINVPRDKNQREDCLCLESIDIGTYNCCNNGCTYCYALQSEQSSINNMKKHNPLSPVLIGDVNPHAIITERDSKTIIVKQLSLF